MTATITLRAPGQPSTDPQVTLVLARVLGWSVHPGASHRHEHPTVRITYTRVRVEGIGVVDVYGDHHAALEQAMAELASVDTDARLIADLKARIEALETVVANRLQREGARDE